MLLIDIGNQEEHGEEKDFKNNFNINSYWDYIYNKYK